MILVFIGSPGSGKGTIAQLFEKKGWVAFSMGQALRDHVKRKGKYAEEVEKLLREGKLARDKVAYDVLHEHLSSLKNKNIIFDGFPRNVKQMNGARKILRSLKKDIAAFIFIDVSPIEVLGRLKARRQCVLCGKIYGRDVQPLKKGICDVDKGKLIERIDDKPSVIKERFRVFNEETSPVLEEASKHYPVFRIAGEGHPSKVFKRIQRVISLLK